MFEISNGGYYESRKYIRNKERTVELYELELSVSGKAKSRFNGEVYERARGDIFFARPGDRRRSAGDFECFYIHFYCRDEEFAEKYLKKFPVYMKCRDFSLMQSAIQQAVMLSEKAGQSRQFGQEYLRLADIKLSELLINLYIQAYSGTPENNEYSSNISEACRFIDKNFGKYITVEDIAKAAMLSESFTYVQFKKHTGQTPHSYLLNKRLDYACRQLIFTDKSAAVISEECGFSNPNYLNSIFKKMFSVTPLQYRKKFRNTL